MSELELVWIKECEICGKEHRRAENHSIKSIDDIDTQTGVFWSKCERWYGAHISTLQACRVNDDHEQEALSDTA